ncbi:MAG: N-acetylmuramoyl-L-alanine amidase [Candidatus Accumulibacter sp.]|uniref:N-acetylmuramoyl-L-alanine amidase n=1 Tax=Candidatus Accumulibacter proximus TaxID=2954385 RepID=A0A935PZS8_9PROT|nr:N-acetylmuramoyl-L-alanine amidase [Candidatus Accumulibacter proximus]
MHYTAGPTLDGAVSWLTNLEAQASAHLVIDRDGSIVQMVAFNRRAWHAGKSEWGNLNGMNRYSFGIELVNAGKLSKNAKGQWLTWSKKVIPSEDVTVAKHKEESSETGWHEYTEAQIQAASMVGLLLHKTYSFTDVLGYDDVSPGRKVDPGPVFPMNSFRSILLRFSRLKKIVLNLIRLDSADKTKTSLRLKRKCAAWKDDVRMRILGFTSLGFTSQ